MVICRHSRNVGLFALIEMLKVLDHACDRLAVGMLERRHNKRDAGMLFSTPAQHSKGPDIHNTNRSKNVQQSRDI
jgi:hypothetical protein